MQKILILLVLVLICLVGLISARGAKARKGQEERTAAQPRDCGQWTEGDCIAKNNITNCGAGTKIKSRTGSNCPVTEKSFKCRIPCAGETAVAAAGGRGRGKARKAACKYSKGQWSECDASTNTRTRSLTLKAPNRRNAAPEAASTCEQSKIQTKRCPPSGANRKNRRGQQ